MTASNGNGRGNGGPPNGPPPVRPRVLVHNDQQYWWDDHTLWTRQPFARFACALREHGVEVTLCGRLERGPHHGGVRIDPRAGFAGLPASTNTAGPLRLLRDAPSTLRRWWNALAVHDVVWLVGPNVWSLPFALAARLRGVPVVLGVRQDMPVYVRHRHPGHSGARLAALLLDGTFRLLARKRPVVVVGSAIAAHYRHSPAVLDVRVALVRRADVAVEPHRHRPPTTEQPLRALSVGRLDREKNPLMLADLLALTAGWDLDVCGDGPLADELAARARALGVAERMTFHGQLDGADLQRRFVEADALVHVSWTEGVPQVILEAFAEGLPVVATDVGGVADAVGTASLLVPPGEPAAVARALDRLARDPALGRRMAREGLNLARTHALEDETAAVTALLLQTLGGFGGPSSNSITDPVGTPSAARPAGRPANPLRSGP